MLLVGGSFFTEGKNIRKGVFGTRESLDWLPALLLSHDAALHVRCIYFGIAHNGVSSATVVFLELCIVLFIILVRVPFDIGYIQLVHELLNIDHVVYSVHIPLITDHVSFNLVSPCTTTIYLDCVSHNIIRSYTIT